MNRFVLFCIIAICLPAALKGQGRDVMDKRWALHYSVGVKPLIKPVLTRHPPQYSSGNSGSAFAVTGEYYMPDQWNMLAGYYRTNVQNGYGLRSMEGLRLGAKKYFLPAHIIFQPYVAGMAELNWSNHAERFIFDASESYTVNPRLSLIPGAGFELYLFSSVALTAEYDFNIGISSHSSYHEGSSFLVQDKGLFHSASVGMKWTFPSTFTWDDADNLVYILTESLISIFSILTGNYNY